MGKDKKPKKDIISPNKINPVDYYNRTCIQDAISLLTAIPAIDMVGKDGLTYVKQYSDRSKKQLIIDEATGLFHAELPNGFGIAVGDSLTAFQMIQKFVHKDSWKDAVWYVITIKMNNTNKYIRVGSDYFKKITKTDRYDIKRNLTKKWKRQELVDDYGRGFLALIPKYDDFTIVPNNKKFKRIIANNYNLYHPFDHKSMPINKYTGEDQWKWTKELIEHIFGNSDEEFEKGIRYLKVLYDHPTQAMPIIVLISSERQTGKTTFVNYLSLLFGANSVIINPQDIGYSFNASYAEKNVIMIEESHFDNRQALEKIKNLATQKEILVNTKHVSQYSIPFFGKLIITSNDENKFSKIDEEEIRYWVLKIPTLVGKANHNIINDLKDEIPAFLCYLNSLPEVDRTKDRMVFTAEEIQTEALVDVKLESRESLHKEILIYLHNHAEQNETIECFHFTGITIKERFFSHNHRYGISYVNKVLRSSIKFEKVEKSMRFVPLDGAGFSPEKLVGKPYVFQNPYYCPGEDPFSPVEPDIEF